MTAPTTRPLGTCAFGRAIDAHGLPLDRGPLLRGRMARVELRSPRPDDRVPLETPLWTGIRVIDGLLTIGRGARIGIFGAPGAGKTTLIESTVAGCAADAVVVALVGERGREAQRWIERRHDWMTVICATSDRPPHERVMAARVAAAQAGSLRRLGLHVLLVIDSLARFSGALREIAISAGESAGRGGFPPSVFAQMAQFVEVAGATEHGSITLIATVINDGDDRDPVSEAARSLLDGHVVLSPRLAAAGRFPAVDVPASASRTMDAVANESHLRAARRVRRALALLERIEDARALGIEPAGRGARAAIVNENRIETFLRQRGTASARDATLAELTGLAALLDDVDEDR
ncbi:MAG: EscN/YscN/HrcN family type III secretion system ATPase [Candidatus Cybelea sp.]